MLGALRLDASRNVEMPCSDKGQTIHLQPQRLELLRVERPHAGNNGRTRFAIQSRQVGRHAAVG